MEKLIVLGGGGNLYDLLDTIEAINEVASTWEIVGILDDGRSVGSSCLGIPIVGDLSDASSFRNCMFVSTIWNSKVSRELCAILSRTRLERSRFATVVHPASFVSPRARLGAGVLVHQAASIGGNVDIGEHVSIGPGCIIGHDTRMAGFTAMAAGSILSGGVQVGQNCYIGSGALVREHVQIGDQTLIGMGAVVVSNPEAGSVVVGNPSRPMLRDARIKS